MLKIITLLLASFIILLPKSAFAATKKRPIVRNDVQIYSTKPNLPADVPYTNTRNRDWLGGYLGGDYNAIDAGDNDTVVTQPQQKRNWRRWKTHRH